MITHHNFPGTIKNDSLGSHPHLFHRLELVFWEIFIRALSNMQDLRFALPSTIFGPANDDSHSIKRYWIITAVSGAVLGFVIGIFSL